MVALAKAMHERGDAPSIEVAFEKLFAARDHKIRNLIKGMTPAHSSETDDDDDPADDLDMGVGELDDDPDDDDLIDRKASAPSKGRGGLRPGVN